MKPQFAMVSVSHSPIILIRAQAPKDEPRILKFYEHCISQIEEFNPELVFVFGTDHFAGFHLSLMPSVCVGLQCEAVDDVGGFPGRLNVPREISLGLTRHLREHDIDTAVSYDMKVDHGFSQPVKRLLGVLDRYPVVPIFIGSLVPPYVPFRRSRLLGEAVASYARTLGKRVLVIGSGGLSHHPTRYYPLVGEGSEDVSLYQMSGAQGGSFSEQAWLDRLYEMHVEGAEMLVSGLRTEKDIRLNPAIDRKFMEYLRNGDFRQIEGWDLEELVAQAGIGFMENHTWVAAASAARALDIDSYQDLYSPTLEYGIGYGMISTL